MKRSDRVTKNGFVRSKWRYRYKLCGYDFIFGDGSLKAETAIKRAFTVILHALGKSSCDVIAELCDIIPAVVQKWLSTEANLLSRNKSVNTV